ncbi:hypothetical protein EVAR_74524_1 [Eumeta japonica]|uniref:TFIIS N-terminal domain-containing protein n=1 Tax=Eumeta variegata TaxID=151549 RepID=A0A4C1TE92_EUMVA|nr:hypothetical protein EVAR_74524_1 [Eumeta japonica]
MGSGGWRLVHMWLTESIVAKNWPLVKELLELLLLCPVDIERLKTNNCPKLVKELSKDGNHFAIRALASKLVEQWLKTVKGENVTLVKLSDIQQIINDVLPDEKNVTNATGSCSVTNSSKQEKPNEQEQTSSVVKEENIVKDEKADELIPESNKVDESEEKNENGKEQETLPVLKISLKDGKQVISQLEESNSKTSEKQNSSEKEKSKSSSRSKDKSSASKSDSSKHKSDSSHKHRSSSHRRDSPSRSSRDKSKDKSKHSSHSSKSSKHSSSSKKSSDKSSSSKSKEEKGSKEENKNRDNRHKETIKVDEQEEKLENKNIFNRASVTLEKMQIPSIHKLGKIPKLNDTKKEAPSISIEVRKPDEPKPKTVKTFNSKFRKHGLDEEIKPPPSRASLLNKKPSPVVPPMVSIPKRPSPVHNEPPPEKRSRTTEPVEKPGVIKLIPAKPKRTGKVRMSDLLVRIAIFSRRIANIPFATSFQARRWYTTVQMQSETEVLGNDLAAAPNFNFDLARDSNPRLAVAIAAEDWDGSRNKFYEEVGPVQIEVGIFHVFATKLGVKMNMGTDADLGQGQPYQVMSSVSNTTPYRSGSIRLSFSYDVLKGQSYRQTESGASR